MLCVRFQLSYVINCQTFFFFYLLLLEYTFVYGDYSHRYRFRHFYL